MASTRGPWLEEEFTKEGESYIVNDGYIEGLRASITPQEEFFDLEIYKNEYEYERDDDIGAYVVGYRAEYLKSRELTVDNIRTAIRDFNLTMPDDLAKELTGWQEQYLDSNKIESNLGNLGDRLSPEEIETVYGGAAPETISERLRVEFGAALAEAEGVAKYGSPKIGVEGFDAPAPRLPFIEEALAAGANLDHISIEHAGSNLTVVSFENAQGTYLLNGKDVYVTEASVQELQLSIEADPISLPGISDLRPASDIEIQAPDVSFSQILDSMGPNNRAILERGLEDGAVVNLFWAERSGENPNRYAMAVVSFESAPGTYIFWNAEDDAHRTQLNFGETRYALDVGYEIRDLSLVSEIRNEENRIEPRGQGRNYALSM